MQKTWILVADASRARIFETEGGQQKIQEIEDFAHPAGRAATRELVTDGQGRFYGKGERDQGHTSAPDVDAVEHDNEIFAKSIAEYLYQARMAHRFERLQVMAAPRFLGLLRQKLHQEVQKAIVDETPKDLSWLNTADIDRYVKARPVAEAAHR
jgi:protein required for attachment to host cells